MTRFHVKQGNGSEISSEGISGANQCPVVFILQATYCPLPWGGGMATDAPTWSRCLVSSLLRRMSVKTSEALAQAGARGGLVALERTVDRGKRPGGASAPRGPGSGTGHSHPGPASPSPAWPLPALAQGPGGRGSTLAPAHCRPESAYSTRVGRHWPAGVRAA